jgi:hypothetical protein
MTAQASKTKVVLAGKPPFLELDFVARLSLELFARRDQASADAPEAAEPISAVLQRQLAERSRVGRQLRGGRIPSGQSLGARLFRRFFSICRHEDDQLDLTCGDSRREIDYGPAILRNGYSYSVRLHGSISQLAFRS